MNTYENNDTKIPKEVQEKWESILNLIVKNHGSFDAVITRYENPLIEIIKVSNINEGMFKEGLVFELSRLFSHETIKNSNLVMISNTLKNDAFKTCDDVQFGYLSYLGVPIKWPSGKIFGTLDLRSKEPSNFNKETQQFVTEVKEIIEEHLNIIIENIQLQNNKYKSLVNSAPIGIFETTATGKIVSINNTMAYILGFSTKEEVIDHYNDLGKDLYVKPSRRETFIKKLNISGEVKNFEYEAFGKNNKTVWVSMNAKKVSPIQSGDFLIQGFAFDITERKNKDKKLEEQKSQLIKAYDQLTTYNEEILAMNEELEYSLEEINFINQRYNKMIELVTKTNERNILNNDDFFKDLLLKAIDIIPEADYGKIGIINNQNQFEFIDAVGHDIKLLKHLKFDKNILFNRNGSRVNYTFDYFFDINKIESDKKEYLKGFKPIKEALYINVLVEGETVGRIGFDIQEGSSQKFSDTTIKVLKSFASLASSFFAFKRFDDLQSNFTKEIITSIIKIMEMYDLYTKGHSESVAEFASAIAKGMNLSKKTIQDVYWAGLVHDIGKLLIPLSILNKNEKLTNTEYELVKKHPIWGNKALSHSKVLKPIAKYILHHHEKWDGTGYPEGLEGEDIPLVSQIIAVADAWDAMLSKRAYRDSLSIDRALEEIKNNKGTQFSPKVTEVFIKMIEKDRIRQLKDEVLKYDINTSEKENHLLKEELNHKILFEEFNDGIVILDETFSIIRANDYFCSMFGYNKDELIGSTIKRIVPREKIDETEKIINQLKHNEKIYAKTTRQKLNNEMIKVSIQGFPITLNKNHMGYYLIYRDVTELEEAKMQYKAIEDRYKMLFDNEDIPMLIIDPESGQIIDANIAAEKFYGWQKSKLKIKNISEINTLSKDEIRNKLLKAKTKNSKRFIFNHRIASGFIKKVQVYSHPIKFGEREYLYSIIHEYKD